MITKLPQAAAVPGKLSKVAAPMYAWFGEGLTRCLLASDWNMCVVAVPRVRHLALCALPCVDY